MLGPVGVAPTRESQVYARLRKAILEGHLEPGQELVTATLAAEMGVSRIPVMHACQRLIGEGLLVANPRRSVTVAPMTEERIVEGTEVLLALECFALEQVARRATEADVKRWASLNEAVRAYRRPPGSLEMNVADYRFHSALWEAAGRPYLHQQLALVYDHNEPARALARVYHDPAASSGEHEAILEALRTHDVSAAQEAIRSHRNHGAERALHALRERQKQRTAS